MYLGRLDNQVKLRGYRVEVGEIEIVLATHELIDHRVVVFCGFNDADADLVAFLVPVAGATPNERDLREHLAAQLPDYMVPRHFVRLVALPKTPNGKIDRKSLSVPQYEFTRSTSMITPQTDTAKAITALWQ